MSDDDVDTPVAESTIGKALKEQCKLDKEMMGLMKVNNFSFFFSVRNEFFVQQQSDSFEILCFNKT